MAQTVSILGVCGSLQRASGNLTLLEQARALVMRGVELRLFDGLRALPYCDPDLEGGPAPAAVEAWRAAIVASDAVLIASPEYGHGLPGALKNAIDWTIGSGELERKIVGVTCAKTTPCSRPSSIATAARASSLQLDLETTGLDPERDRVFLAAVRGPDTTTALLELESIDDRGERALIERIAAHITALDPDVIENHNLHGFDLPFLVRRAQLVGATLSLARWGPPGLRQRAVARGAQLSGMAPNDPRRRLRYTMPGRELIDTLDAVRRHDFSARDLPGHGLKAVARHFGIEAKGAAGVRELVPGSRVYATWCADPERVRRYAAADVEEAGALAQLMSGAAFALAQMAPRPYERQL